MLRFTVRHAAILGASIVIGALPGCGDSAVDSPGHGFSIDQSKEKQANRMQMIERLSDENVFPKITFADNGALIWVGSKFHGLDEQTKMEYVKEIHAYGYRPEKGVFAARLKDIKSGMQIGEYLPDTGLQLK